MILTFSSHLSDVAGSGEQPALAEVFKLYSGRVGGLCRHLLHDPAMAEDATSEVFLRVRDGLGHRDRSVPLERWVLRIAVNHCIDVLRRRRLERRWFAEDVSGDPPSAAATPLSLVLMKEQRELVERSIAVLEEPYRIPLVLRYYADLCYEEIAAELHIEKTQVAGRIFRAKQMLRVLLKEAL